MQKRRSDDHGVPLAQHAGDGDHGRLISRRGFLAGAAGAGAAAGLASLGLTGCAADRGPNSLTVAVNGTQAAAEAIKAAVGPPFLARHPKVQLNFMAVNGTDWADYFAKILTLIAGGLAPDLTSVATEGLQLFASKGIAEPLDDYVKRDKADLAGYFSDVHPVLVESMMYQGHLYMLPTDFNCGNMFFDTVLLDKAGVGYPADGWTRDDFYDMAQKWARVPDAVGWDWVVRLWGSWTSWMYANNANLVSEGRWPGGGWMWDTFYPDDPAARGRGGGWRRGEPTANDPKIVYARPAGPSLATVAVLAFAAYWNEFFRPLIFLSTPGKFTLPLGLVTLQGYLGTGSVSVVLAGVMLSLIPTLVVFLFAQRRLVEGLTLGSVKG